MPEIPGENSFALQTKHKFAYILFISSVHILFGSLQCDYFLFTRVPSSCSFLAVRPNIGPFRAVACGHNDSPHQVSSSFEPDIRVGTVLNPGDLLPADVPIFDGIMQRLFSSSPDQIDESNCNPEPQHAPHLAAASTNTYSSG